MVEAEVGELDGAREGVLSDAFDVGVVRLPCLARDGPDGFLDLLWVVLPPVVAWTESPVGS